MAVDYLKYLKNIPVIPDVVIKVLHLADNNIDFSANELEKLISIDPGITVKIIRVANSAIYARQKQIST